MIVCGIMCKTCNYELPPMLMSEHLDATNIKNQCLCMGLNKLAWIMGLSDVSELTEETVSAFRNVREAYFEDKEAVLAEFEKREKRDRKKKASKRR